jgi:hypothetical protein
MATIRKSRAKFATGGAVAADDAVADVPMAAAPEQPLDDPLANNPLPESAKNYLRDHPDYMYNPDLNAKIQALHWKLVDEGFEEYSPVYFEELDWRMGQPSSVDAPAVDKALAIARVRAKAAPPLDDYDPPVPPLRRGAVSAPPSREVPTSDGGRLGLSSPSQIRLTPEMKHAAAISGISEAEYARQLIRLREAKARGDYPGG